MKYIIERASAPMFSHEVPCEGCVEEDLHEIMWDGSISNDTVKRWTIEIEDPIEFVDKYGKIVLGKSDVAEVCYEITIYDSWIE